MKRDGWKFYGAIALVAIGCLWLVAPVHGDIEDCIAATCKVRASDGSTGSGCLYGVGPIEQGGEDLGWVLTAAHVAVGRDLDCQFGRAAQRVRVRVYWRREGVDAGVLVAPWRAFPKPRPRPIRVAPPAVRIKVGQSIFSTGFPGGGPMSLLTARVKSYSGGAMWFHPGPELGRSGSPIFAYLEGKPAIVGIISARDSKTLGPNTIGRAITPAMMYGNSDRLTASVWHPVQCPPGQVCPAPGYSERNYLDPYRQGQKQRNEYLYKQIQERSQGTSPLPQPVGPTEPPVDIKPLEGRVTQLEFEAGAAQAERAELKRRADLVRDTAASLAEKYEKQLPGISADVGAAIEASAAAAEAAKTAAEVAEGAEEKAAETQETVDTALDEENPTGVVGRLKARIAEAKAEAVAEGKEGIKAVPSIAKDVAMGILQSYGIPAGIAGLVLAFVVWDIRKKVTEGDPLLVEKVAARVRDRVGPVRERIVERVGDVVKTKSDEG